MEPITPPARGAGLSSACSTDTGSLAYVESGRPRLVGVRLLPGGVRHREHTSARPGLCPVGEVQLAVRHARTSRSRRSDHVQVHHSQRPARDRAMPRRSRPHRAAASRARRCPPCRRPVIDQRGQLLRAAVGFGGCSLSSYDRALWALRSWLDSWAQPMAGREP
jgi:hypothetical protein